MSYLVLVEKGRETAYRGRNGDELLNDTNVLEVQIPPPAPYKKTLEGPHGDVESVFQQFFLAFSRA
jgi:hypothetical protein